MSGVVDERAQLAVSEQSPQGPVVVDLDGVSLITSYGVGKWIRAFRELTARPLYFVRCRPTIVSQLNSIAGFGCQGEVVSFYAPYICLMCDIEVQVLIDARRVAAEVAEGEAPTVHCPQCNSPTRFDDAPERYFHFVKAQRPPSPPPAAAAMIDRVHGAGPEAPQPAPP